MKLRQFYSTFKKSLDANRSARAAFEAHQFFCDSCNHAMNLSVAAPLTIYACPKCGFKNLVPYLLNDYLLFEPLGAGGVSSVYKAIKRDSPKHHYAVKILRDDKAVDEAILQEFLFEAEVHQAVSPHDSIVRFIESGNVDDDYYHVMEFLVGESVKHRVETSGRIPEQIALSWTLEFINALQHIHDKGFLYRDISPGNLIVRTDNSICVIDFGLALSLADADSRQPDTPIAGTPEYLPPERIQHMGEDIRSTVYSVGMLLFYMLKGEPMIKADSHERAALQHISAVRVAFNKRMLPPDIDEKVVALLGWMIKYDPVDRPQDLHTVTKALKAIRPA